MTKKFTTLQQKIVDYVTANPKCNGAEIQKAVTGSAIGNIYPTLGALVKKGVLIKLRNKRYMINHAYTLKREAKGTNLERIKREIEAMEKSFPVESPLERILQAEIKYIEDGIDSLMVTKSYLLRRIEQVRADAKL